MTEIGAVPVMDVEVEVAEGTLEADLVEEAGSEVEEVEDMVEEEVGLEVVLEAVVLATA